MRSTLHRRLLLVATALSLSGLTACAQTVHGIPTSGTSNPACLALHPLTFSKNDTPETKEEVRTNNAALRSLCPNFEVKP